MPSDDIVWLELTSEPTWIDDAFARLAEYEERMRRDLMIPAHLLGQLGGNKPPEEEE
jgi:hypothetical protein